MSTSIKEIVDVYDEKVELFMGKGGPKLYRAQENCEWLIIIGADRVGALRWPLKRERAQILG